MPGFRKPLDVESYISALGDDEVELKHVMKLSERGRFNGVDEDPYKWPNDGVAASSTSSVLARRDDIIWDPNGYYSSLGFTENLRDVTKKQLRLAYRRLLDEPDIDRVWVTYCFKQLINIRDEYNAIPFGEFFFDDYWETYYKQQASAQVAERRAQGEDIDIEEILARWGLQAVSDEPPPEIDFEAAQAPPEVPKIESDWDWAFYVWNARSVNLSYLESWQRMVIRALNANRQFGHYMLDTSHFAVGVRGHDRTADTPKVSYGMAIENGHKYFVFYLRSDIKPNEKDAEEVVRKLLKSLRNGYNTEQYLRVRGKPARV